MHRNFVHSLGTKLSMFRTVLLVISVLSLPAAWAGFADVLKVKVHQVAPNQFNFSVTLRHQDSGWDHYANRWQIISPQGKVIATRHLSHPHINEQPFTRSLFNVAILPTTTWVKLRAVDIKHGGGGREVTVSIPHQ